jgi:[protein-PII] uridylyltransferase
MSRTGASREPTRAARRRARAAAADARLRSLWVAAHRDRDVDPAGVALVAVGGYGRSELSPSSDLDLVLLAGDGYDDQALASLADALWYPLWDDHVRLDHAVRTQTELRTAASRDVRVALGVLDLRPVAGDAALALRARNTLLTDWRRTAKRSLPELAQSTRDRWTRVGDLAHATTPDLKDSRGGL